MATTLSPAERIVQICELLGEAFQAEMLADHIVCVAAAREVDDDAGTAHALRAMARNYRVRALRTWGDIALLGSIDPGG